MKLDRYHSTNTRNNEWDHHHQHFPGCRYQKYPTKWIYVSLSVDKRIMKYSTRLYKFKYCFYSWVLAFFHLEKNENELKRYLQNKIKHFCFSLQYNRIICVIMIKNRMRLHAKCVYLSWFKYAGNFLVAAEIRVVNNSVRMLFTFLNSTSLSIFLIWYTRINMRKCE